MTLPLQDVARVAGSVVTPPPIPISGWSVDTRSIASGDLFFALRGPTHDGHDYVGQAFSNGAAAAVVDREMSAPGPLLIVPDAQVALSRIAALARLRWGGVVIGVTGSAGKTTTKDAIAHLLASVAGTGKSEGNYNNHVGLPLSILRLPNDTRLAVLEMGMNHAGEIRELASIARPDIGVVTSVGYAHAGYFDSLEAIAAAKRELIESLPPGGTAILNADDDRVAGFRRSHPGPVLTFGFSEGADVRAVAMEDSGAMTRFCVDGAGWFETSLFGRHGVRNLLAALAVARALGHEPGEFAGAVKTFEAGSMRGRVFTHRGITIIDDCYNSNPEAVRAMLEALHDLPAQRRIAVLGEMLELGRWTEHLHRDTGRSVVECGVSVLVGIRGAARLMADAASGAGLPAGAAYFFEDPEQAGDHLKTMARAGDAILFKGSRGTHVELALKRFMD